eukprot:scaffold15378_cov112-Isochrysis_galbana.AAC.3
MGNHHHAHAHACGSREVCHVPCGSTSKDKDQGHGASFIVAVSRSCPLPAHNGAGSCDLKPPHLSYTRLAECAGGVGGGGMSAASARAAAFLSGVLGVDGALEPACDPGIEPDSEPGLDAGHDAFSPPPNKSGVSEEWRRKRERAFASASRRCSRSARMLSCSSMHVCGKVLRLSALAGMHSHPHTPSLVIRSSSRGIPELLLFRCSPRASASASCRRPSGSARRWKTRCGVGASCSA